VGAGFRPDIHHEEHEGHEGLRERGIHPQIAQISQISAGKNLFSKVGLL
jgi:hypothetical protein